MEKLEKELKKLNILLSMNNFCCGFIVIDKEDEETISFLKNEISNDAMFVSNCNDVETLNKTLTNIIKNGEKIILYNLKSMYELFGVDDLNNDGIFNFYQKITESYRDKLWQNNRGQLFFILTYEEYEQFYSPKDVIERVTYFDKLVEKRYVRDNHFRTMLTITIDLTSGEKHKKKIKT